MTGCSRISAITCPPKCDRAMPAQAFLVRHSAVASPRPGMPMSMSVAMSGRQVQESNASGQGPHTDCIQVHDACACACALQILKSYSFACPRYDRMNYDDVRLIVQSFSALFSVTFQWCPGSTEYFSEVCVITATLAVGRFYFTSPRYGVVTWIFRISLIARAVVS